MTANKKLLNTTALVLCGLFAALNAICASITIPLGFTPIPINLGTLGVFLTGGLMGKKYGSISIMVYIFLGAVGLPVFSGFRGGLGVLTGPTGGYIVGYLAAVFVIGLITEKSCITKNSEVGKNTGLKKVSSDIIAMLIGLLLCYLLGTLWFMFTTGAGIGAALASCVIPFLPGDALKITAAAFLAVRLRPATNIIAYKSPISN